MSDIKELDFFQKLWRKWFPKINTEKEYIGLTTWNSWKENRDTGERTNLRSFKVPVYIEIDKNIHTGEIVREEMYALVKNSGKRPLDLTVYRKENKYIEI